MNIITKTKWESGEESLIYKHFIISYLPSENITKHIFKIKNYFFSLFSKNLKMIIYLK